MNRLEEQYRTQILPALKEQLSISNIHAVPKIEKIVINAGLGKSIQDPEYVDAALRVLTRITGQMPVKTLAKRSISNFKIRQGMVVGAKVTLRGERMYAFLDKLINVALPRVRDFRGVPRTGFDGRGNNSLGFPEHIVFPEIALDEVEKIVGMEINIVTTAENDDHGRLLLTQMGFPFERVEEKEKKQSK